jgi:hypothetical protein
MAMAQIVEAHEMVEQGGAMGNVALRVGLDGVVAHMIQIGLVSWISLAVRCVNLCHTRW